MGRGGGRAADGSPLGTPPGKPSIVCGAGKGRKAAQNHAPEPDEFSVNLALSPLIVLDTNVVLDWLLFDDPRVAPVARAVMAGRARWIASASMRDELDRVLRRGIASRPQHPTGTVMVAFDRWSTSVESASPAFVPSLRCSDPDDQKFIDLAVQQRAAMLVSRDRAVLRLARAATAVGLRIVVPERWID